MSNSTRILIGYAGLLGAVVLILGTGLLASLVTEAGAPRWVSVAIALLGFAVVMGVNAWFQFKVCTCWRCETSLFRSPLGPYVPLVTWTYCPHCSVRHSATPAEVRANPMGKFRR